MMKPECGCGPHIHSAGVPHWLYCDALERVQTRKWIGVLKARADAAKTRVDSDAVHALAHYIAQREIARLRQKRLAMESRGIETVPEDLANLAMHEAEFGTPEAQEIRAAQFAEARSAAYGKVAKLESELDSIAVELDQEGGDRSVVLGRHQKISVELVEAKQALELFNEERNEL